MAATLGMGTITARSIARWKSANGKRKAWSRKFERGAEVGKRSEGTHPTKGMLRSTLRRKIAAALRAAERARQAMLAEKRALQAAPQS